MFNYNSRHMIKLFSPLWFRKWNYINMGLFNWFYSITVKPLKKKRKKNIHNFLFFCSYPQPQSPKRTSKDLQFWLFLLVTHHSEFTPHPPTPCSTFWLKNKFNGVIYFMLSVWNTTVLYLNIVCPKLFLSCLTARRFLLCITKPCLQWYWKRNARACFWGL